MSAAVETGAFHVNADGVKRGALWSDDVGTVPWHGLGVQVGNDLSAEDMMRAAGLDWTVSCRPVFVQNPDGSMTEVGNRQALVRDSDAKFFDFSSHAWKPVQNVDAFEFFKQFVDAGDAKMEAAGSLQGGKVIFALANLNADHVLSDGDTLKSYLLLANSHRTGQAFVIKQTNTRVVCANKLAIALGAEFGSTNAIDDDGTFKMTHYREFDAKTMEEARNKVGLARDSFGKFAKLANQLKKIGIDRDVVMKIITPIYAPKVEAADMISDFEKHATPTMWKVIESLCKAPGAEPDTAWGLLNAVTHYEDHVSGRSTDTRQASALFGAGAGRKATALKSIVELVAA